jgi:hypothetical protein
MKNEELNTWLENTAKVFSNKEVVFVEGNYQEFKDSLKSMQDSVTIINLRELKKTKNIPSGINQIIILEDYSQEPIPIDNMKSTISRGIIYIKDVNSIYKFMNLINNKSLDTTNEVKYELIQKVDFVSLFKKNNLDIKRFIFDRLDLLKKINCNFEHMNIDSLIICLDNYFKNKILFASFAQLLYRLANLDFESSERSIGGNIRRTLGIKSKIINRKNLVSLKVEQLEKNFRVYDLKENTFVMDTKVDIAKKLVKLNLKGLDVIKVAEITELPLKKVEKMYREAFIK